MQFHILDENYTPITVMDNVLPDAINFNNSKFHRFITGSADFFDFETSKLHVDHHQFQVGYWLAFRYDDRDRLQYINGISEAESDKMMTISSASSNLDLNNETKQPFSATEAKPFKWYFDTIMFDTGYEIGINEISNLTRKLSWESSMTIRAFIQSVATQFDNAELDYEVVLNSDFTIKKRLVHIKKRIGEVRDDIELRYGDNVKTIKRTTSISELCTAVIPVSKDDNDKVINISSLNDWQELDEKGNIKFFHKKGSNLIFAPQANARFGNRGHNVTGGGYIVHDFSYDKVSQSELFNRSLSYLKEHSVPAINYEVEGRTGAKIGDTVKIVDDGYTPELILSARVLEQVVSFDDATVEQATFGNYKALQSQISADLIAKMQQLAEENAPYKAVTLTTNGLTFKNSEGSTTLTARLYKGSKEIVPESYVWTIDGVAISENSEQHEITAEDINGKAVVRWSAVINGVTVAFDEVTITDVSDGKPTGVTQSDTEPTETYEGMLWKYTGTDDLPVTGTTAVPQVTYVSTDDNWKVLDLPPENINTPTLSKLSDDWGDIKAGSFTNWQYSVGQASNTLNGVYIANGRELNLSIENPKSQDPDFKGVAKGVAVRGTESYAGIEQHYMKLFPVDNNQSANEIIKDFVNFWTVQNRAARFSSYIYENGIKQLMITTDELLITGKATAAGQRGYAGNVMLSSEARAVNIVPNTPYTIGSLANFDALKLYGQLFARRNFTLELDLTGPQLQYPDFAGYTRMVSATTGSRNEGADSREFMVYACINSALNTLLLKVFYRDGGNNWTENTSNTNTIYKVVPIIY